jgi:hypothetical protein
MGARPSVRNKAGNMLRSGPLKSCGFRKERAMEDREKISNGPNDRALNETIAGTGPGIPDDALAPGEELPPAPSEEEVRRVAKALGVPEQSDDQQQQGD